VNRMEKDETQRIEELKKLLKSDNVILRNAAKAELERGGFKIEDTNSGCEIR